jgi:hypothetical protein
MRFFTDFMASFLTRYVPDFVSGFKEFGQVFGSSRLKQPQFFRISIPDLKNFDKDLEAHRNRFLTRFSGFFPESGH